MATPTPNAVFQALHRFADRFADPMADEILRAFGATRESIDLDALESVLTGIYDRAPFARAASAPVLTDVDRAALLRAMQIDDVLQPELAARLTRMLSRLTTGGATVTVATMPERIRPAFNIVNPRAVTFARREAGKLVREVTDEQRKLVARLVARGIREGIEPRKTAKILRESIGLTRHQEGIVARFRDVHAEDMLARAATGDTLLEPQRKVLRRLQAKRPTTAAQADRLAAQYRDLKVRDRAMSIARTETIRASAGGQQVAWDEAGKQGLIVAEETRQFWMYTLDSRTECACLSIPPLNPKGVKLGQPFLMRDCHGGGGIRRVFRPGDPHPTCRCVLYVRFIEVEARQAA